MKKLKKKSYYIIKFLFKNVSTRQIIFNHSIENISIISGTYIFISIVLLFIIKGKLNPTYQEK